MITAAVRYVKELRDLVYQAAHFEPATWAALVHRMHKLALCSSVPLSQLSSWLGTASTLLRNRKFDATALRLDWRPLYDALRSRYIDSKVTSTATASSPVDSQYRANLLQYITRARRYVCCCAAWLRAWDDRGG